MTGRIFTSDHRVYDLPELLSWEVVHTGTVPCDSYSVAFPYDRSMAEVLRLAAGFAAIHQGKTVLRAIVDEYSVELGAGGLTAAITGRGYAARLLDNESRPLTYQEATLAEIVRQHVTPYGITAGEVADVRASSIYTVPAGVSQWRALESFCRTYGGFSPRFSRDGKLLAAPERDGGRRLSVRPGGGAAGGSGDAGADAFHWGGGPGALLRAAGGPLRRADGGSGHRQDQKHLIQREK